MVTKVSVEILMDLHVFCTPEHENVVYTLTNYDSDQTSLEILVDFYVCSPPKDLGGFSCLHLPRIQKNVLLV
jgi:hypothetical protein